MKRRGDWPGVTDGPTLGPEGAGVAALLAPRGLLPGPPLECRPAILLDHTHDATGQVFSWQPVPRRQFRQPASPPLAHSRRLHAPPLSSALERNGSQARRNRLLEDGAWTPTLLVAAASSDRPARRWLLRLVSLSVLGWAFVLAAVLWGRFAYAFSHCAGCGWREGGFFFAWGLGILVFGFFLRASRERPAASRLFLGANILVVSVLYLVLATR
jgi:hypothetical protein